MLYLLLGLITLVWTGATAIGLIYLLWLSLAKPWRFMPRIPVPREVSHLEWAVPDQDNPIPWI